MSNNRNDQRSNVGVVYQQRRWLATDWGKAVSGSISLCATNRPGERTNSTRTSPTDLVARRGRSYNPDRSTGCPISDGGAKTFARAWNDSTVRARHDWFSPYSPATPPSHSTPIEPPRDRDHCQSGVAVSVLVGRVEVIHVSHRSLTRERRSNAGSAFARASGFDWLIVYTRLTRKPRTLQKTNTLRSAGGSPNGACVDF